MKAIKGEAFRGYAIIKVLGPQFRLNSQTIATAKGRWYQWAAEQIIAKVPGEQNIVLVPVPNKIALVKEHPAPFPTWDLASGIALNLRRRRRSAQAEVLLRWSEPVPSAHNGGPRDPGILITKLKLRKEPIPAGQIVLVDDMVTSTGHFAASAGKLDAVGRCPALAIAAGRREVAPLADPFKVAVSSVEPYRLSQSRRS